MSDKQLYRYHESWVDSHQVGVYLGRFAILRTTKCGVWIDMLGAEKFVNLQARKQYACVTPEKALDSYIARKKRQISILKGQLDKAEKGLYIASHMKVKDE